MGRGDEKAADQAAVDAMRQALNSLAIDGTVVIGEGERDEAPMLYIGEKVGTRQGPADRHRARSARRHDDHRQGRRQRARRASRWPMHGGFLNAPDVYMDKIAVGGGLPDGVVDLDETPAQNLQNLAKAKKVEVADLVVCILDRPRHAELIAKVREAGARIMLIGDGDVSRRHRHLRPPRPASTSTWARAARRKACWRRRRCAASAARCRAGCCSATTTSAAAPSASGITDLDRKYELLDLAHGRRDVRRDRRHQRHDAAAACAAFAGGASTHSVVMRSKTGTVRYVEAKHDFTRKQSFAPLRPLIDSADSATG